MHTARNLTLEDFYRLEQPLAGMPVGENEAEEGDDQLEEDEDEDEEDEEEDESGEDEQDDLDETDAQSGLRATAH